MATAPFIETPAATNITTETVKPKFRLHLLHPEGVSRGTHAQGDRINIDNYIAQKFKDETPQDNADLFTCEVEVIPGVKLKAYAWGNHVFVEDNHDVWQSWRVGNKRVESDEPFITVRVVSDKAYTKKVMRNVRREKPLTDYERRYGRHSGQMHWVETELLDGYTEGSGHYNNGYVDNEIPFAYLQIEVSTEGAEPVVGEFKFQQPTFGTAVLGDEATGEVTVSSNFFGMTREWNNFIHPHTHLRKRDDYYSDRYEKQHNSPLSVLKHHLTDSTCPDGADEWWKRFLAKAHLTNDLKGLAAVLKKKTIKPAMARLETESPVDFAFFRWLQDGRTVDKQRNNSLLAAMLKSIGDDYDKLVAALRKARTDASVGTGGMSYSYWQRDNNDDARRAVCLNLPGAKEKVEEQAAKADFRKAKTAAGKADGLGVDAKKYPKLRKAIESGDIPISVFTQPDGNPVNREFAIWEKSLKRKGWAEAIGEIAKDAGRRSTYEKDITPYLSFLFRIEKYLKRHTKQTWKAEPKYVQSQWELEMDDDATQNGTSKRRSAFTPVADNETNIITVPYVAVHIGGRRAQWCYSMQYHVFEEGLIDAISGGVIVSDLEKGLNGRDDYGLMYFTLTGTSIARGYPTFLIIFERREQQGSSTFVHFHRVHPCRSKNRVPTPACQLVERCYQYMAGNIPADDIQAQQGDMIYIPHTNDPIAAKAKVDPNVQVGAGLNFESHNHVALDGEQAIKLYTSTAKTPRNRLGFIQVPTGGMAVRHPEHDDIENLPEGWYEIRRARSYENNPVAVWSLTID